MRKTENRGGRRAGAGRKRTKGLTGPPRTKGVTAFQAPNKTLSQDGVDRMTEAAGRFAKKYKVSIEELFLSIAYGVDFAEEVALPTQLKALERVREAMTPKIQEGGLADSGSPPAILPIRQPDPAKVH